MQVQQAVALFEGLAREDANDGMIQAGLLPHLSPPFENVRGGVSCAVCGEDGHHHSETWLCRWGRGGRNQHGGGGGGFLDSARRMERQPRRHSEPARPYSGRGPPPPPPGDRRWQSPPGPHYHNPLQW